MSSAFQRVLLWNLHDSRETQTERISPRLTADAIAAAHPDTDPLRDAAGLAPCASPRMGRLSLSARGTALTPCPATRENTMRNATRTATAILAATIITGAAACGAANQTATPSVTPSVAQTQTQGTPSQTPTQTATQSTATPSASAATPSAEYTQEQLQATVDQLEATPKALMGLVTNNTPAGSVKDNTRLMQVYDAMVKQYQPMDDPNEDALGLDGTWARTSYDATVSRDEPLDDISDTNLPGVLFAHVLEAAGAPDGTGTTFTDGQWAHAEWTGYRAIWKTDGNRYTLYIIMA